MKPIEAWAIKDPDPDYGLIIKSIADEPSVARNRFMELYPKYCRWPSWHRLGYHAVKVRIEEDK